MSGRAQQEAGAPVSVDEGAARAVLHDSFLVRDGKVLGVDAHIDRLAESSGWPRALVVPAYMDLLRAAVATAEWTFPLVTLKDGQLSYLIRPVDRAALRADATLWTPDEPDSRRAPRHKGPDFRLQKSLRRRAEEAGADEAVLIGPDGIVREGAFSSIVHWIDGALVVSSSQLRLPSVTEAAVVRAAESNGVSVERRASRPEELRGADEIWLLSALHGIRVVRAWDGERIRNVGLAQSYRARLRAMEQAAAAWIDGASESMLKPTESTGATDD